MYASATCSTSEFLPQTAKRFDSNVCFCYLLYITLLPQKAKRFDSVSFTALADFDAPVAEIQLPLNFG
ncbi:hypothetical protein D5086_027249 [Populus alba]|uniref:Uncharacterized protein n=1 Tax=Populus alba TaxID=43335 RepID=A0ACC4AV08_POPAL